MEEKTVAGAVPSTAEPLNGTALILILEDDADVRALVASQLSGFGYEVLAAENGQEALALLGEHSDIALLFSDVMLPGGMSGPQAVTQALIKQPDLKVLLTSGYPEKDVEDLRINGKDVAILRKPYNKGELAEAVGNAMNSV